MNVKEQINEYLLNHETVNVVIAGITCSGKTTLANEIKEYFTGKYPVTIISQDDYFKNLCDIPRSREGYLTDSIEAFHTKEFKNDVQKLLQNGVTTMPRYDVDTNTRMNKNKIVRSSKINIYEGLHTITLLKELNNCIKIFVDTDINTCLNRRIQRDRAKYKIPQERVRQYFNDCIKPMCEKYIFEQRNSANIVINGKGGEFNDS